MLDYRRKRRIENNCKRNTCGYGANCIGCRYVILVFNVRSSKILIPAAMTNYLVFYKYRNRCTKLEMTTNAAWTVMPCLNPNMKNSK